MSHSQFESSLLTPAFRDWLCLRLIKAAACQRGLLRKGLNKAASASATTDDIGNSSEADSDTTWHWEVSDFEEEDCEEEESPKDAVGESRPTILEDMQYVDKLKLDFNEDTETMMENPFIFKNKAAIWVVSAKSVIIQVGIGKILCHPNWARRQSPPRPGDLRDRALVSEPSCSPMCLLLGWVRWQRPPRPGHTRE